MLVHHEQRHSAAQTRDHKPDFSGLRLRSTAVWWVNPLRAATALTAWMLSMNLNVAAAQVRSSSITIGTNVLVSRGEAFPHVEPHLAANPRDPNNLVAAAMTFPKPGRGSRVRAYVSRDGGQRWTSQVLDTASLASQDDPQVAFAPDGTVYLSHLPGRV